jgi:hypothetical protein
MPISRRDVVRSMWGALGAAALVAAAPSGAWADERQGAAGPDPAAKPSRANGRVTLYGEDSSAPYFALVKMPEGIKKFTVTSFRPDQVGRLIIIAAEKGWEVHVTYIRGEGGEGCAFDVCVKDFRSH